MRRALIALAVLAGCAAGEDLDTRGGNGPNDSGEPEDAGSGDDSGEPEDAGSGDDTSGGADTSTGADTGSATDSATGTDTGATVDTGSAVDTGPKDTGTPPTDTGTGGPITGGPCISGAKGATAFRVRWMGSGSGSTAYVSYEVTGLPDKAGFKVGAYSTSIGYKPVFSDPFLGEGGLELSGTAFVDVDLSTIGIGSIKSATLSLYGRSFNTTASGSFTWMTFDGSGASGSISNAAPYHWDGTSVVSGVTVGKAHKLRIKPGGPSGALIVNRIELCIEAT